MLATILALSAIDYDHLARTIQVEAAKGTMDEYCVAVSVLNVFVPLIIQIRLLVWCMPLDNMRVSPNGDQLQILPL